MSNVSPLINMRTLFLALLSFPCMVLAQMRETSDISEAMAVCDNMTMYVQAAQRQLGQGMPKTDAKNLTSGLMNANMKSDPELKAAAIGLVMDIYEYVFSNEQGKSASVETVLANTCGNYKNLGIPKSAVEKHLSTTAQSAWNPMERVPLCVKQAQSAANIGSARDKGMAKEQIADVSFTALSNDKVTKFMLPELIDQVYENPEIEVQNIYAFNLAQCRARMNSQTFPPLKDMKAGILKCQSESTNEARKQCGRTLFHFDRQG